LLAKQTYKIIVLVGFNKKISMIPNRKLFVFSRSERRAALDVLRLDADTPPTHRPRQALADANVYAGIPVDPVRTPGSVPRVSNAVRQGQEAEAGGLVMRSRALLRVHVQERRLPHLQRHR
jgi:hypothetical protein